MSFSTTQCGSGGTLRSTKTPHSVKWLLFDKLLFVGPEELGKRFILCGSQQSIKDRPSKGLGGSRFSESEGFQARQEVLSCSLLAGRCSILPMGMGMSPKVGFIYQLSLEGGDLSLQILSKNILNIRESQRPMLASRSNNYDGKTGGGDLYDYLKKRIW